MISGWWSVAGFCTNLPILELPQVLRDMRHIFVGSACEIVANVTGLKTSVLSYRDLVVWQKSMVFVTEIYRFTQNFPPAELYGLTSQLRRAAVSVPSNIAEGQARLSTGEFKQFLGHARGSLMEVETQILLAAQLGYLKAHEVDALLNRTGEVGVF